MTDALFRAHDPKKETLMPLSQDGFFRIKGCKKYLMGLNYLNRRFGHTSAWWKEMDFDEVRTDLKTIRALGAEAIRLPMPMTLMPRPGRIDRSILKHFDRILSLADEQGLGVIPNPFHTGKIREIPWMDPAKAYTDPELFRYYVQCLDAVMRPHKKDPRVLAWDICSEAWWMIGKPPSRPVFTKWMLALIAAARKIGADQPLIFGFDHSGIVFDVGGDIDALMDHIDIMVMHSYSRYPIGGFRVDDVNSLRDTYYNSFILRRSTARPMPCSSMEFGNHTLYMSEARQEAHLRVTLHSLLANGSQSFFPWNFTDFDERLTGYYPDALGELHFGMVHTDRSLKPAGRVYREFSRLLDRFDPDRFRALAPDTAILVPTSYYQHLGYWSQAHFNAYCGAKQAGLNIGFTRLKDDWSGYRALIVPGNQLSMEEMRKMRSFAKEGGTVLLSASHNKGDAWYIRDAMGAGIEEIRVVDDPFTLSAVSARDGLKKGEKFVFRGPGGSFQLVLEPTTAEVLMKDGQGNPALLRNRFGKGTFLTLTHPVDYALSTMSRAPRTSAAWHILRVLKRAAGISYPVEAEHPNIETGCFRTDNGVLGMFVNHDTEPVSAPLRVQGKFRTAKDFRGGAPGRVPLRLFLPPSGVRVTLFER